MWVRVRITHITAMCSFSTQNYQQVAESQKNVKIPDFNNDQIYKNPPLYPFHICTELEGKGKIFVKQRDYLLGFTIFFNNFSNFPGACEKPSSANELILVRFPSPDSHLQIYMRLSISKSLLLSFPLLFKDNTISHGFSHLYPSLNLDKAIN